MKSKTSKILMIFCAACLAVAVYADSAHFKPKGHPNYTKPSSLTLTQCGTVAGLGNQDLCITLTATAQPIAACQVPGSSKEESPGQNPAVVTVSGALAVPASAIKNGTLTYCVTTVDPFAPSDTISPSSSDFSCANPNWTEKVKALLFSSATVSIAQPGNCSLTPPGPVVLSETDSLPNL